MFNDLKGNGRVWIYTSQRPLNTQEQAEIREIMQSFTREWAAHGAQLRSAFDIVEDHFLVLAVDEDFEAASGCSIDSSVEVFRQIDSKYQLDLFNRMNLAFSIADQVKIIKMAELNTAVQQGNLDLDHLFYDNSISDLHSLRSSWKKPIKDSWINSRIKHLA